MKPERTDRHTSHAVAPYPLACGVALLSALALSGCSSNYVVRDPDTDATYFTHDVKHPGFAGAVRFKDERSGSTVTLPSSEVKEVPPDEYNRELTQQQR